MKTIKEFIEHPMEGLFDLPPGTTVQVREENDTIAEIPKDETYDNKDVEIENKTQQIFDAAMTAFQAQSQHAALAEPKYSARNMEVAAQFLNTALAAIKQRAEVKGEKSRFKNTPGRVVNNTNIIMSRNELLKRVENNEKIIDQEQPPSTPDEIK